jgi:phospholipid/cholesterol/gamma-HCH transport system ATP-binding protein
VVGTELSRAQQAPATVDVVGVRLAFGERRVFDGLTCHFAAGLLSCVLGASGGGKSSLLRMIASLLRPDYGDIRIGGQEITRLSEGETRKVRRRIGMMFQGGALLDSMTVFDNVALPLREHTELSEVEIAERVHAQFEAVGLKGVDDLLPGQLSGGMKKRAALARAMIGQPDILLADEPFSGLDPVAVRIIEALLVETNERTGVTMILTNHDIASTLRMADHVVFLVDGSCTSGSPDQIRASIDPRVRTFLRAASPGPLEPESE